ncbi:hypothetical protein QOT17_014198 [Balamuthia mandrillaris]
MGSRALFLHARTTPKQTLAPERATRALLRPAVACPLLEAPAGGPAFFLSSRTYVSSKKKKRLAREANLEKVLWKAPRPLPGAQELVPPRTALAPPRDFSVDHEEGVVVKGPYAGTKGYISPIMLRVGKGKLPAVYFIEKESKVVRRIPARYVVKAIDWEDTLQARLKGQEGPTYYLHPPPAQASSSTSS